MDLSRDLVKGNLSMIILKLLQTEGEMYGYQLSNRIKQVSDDKINIQFGSLYPALHKLKNDGLINMRESHEGARKRVYYSLSEKGREKTLTWGEDYMKFFDMMKMILSLKPTSQ